MARAQKPHPHRTQGKSRMMSLFVFAQAIPVTACSSMPNHRISVIKRDAVDCPASNLTACPSPIPFCCPTTSNCIPLTRHNTSVICCPDGVDCSIIATVSCDINLQDAQQFPYQLLHTTHRHAQLPKCGNQCCPHGYLCQGGHCVMKSRNTSPPSKSSSGAKQHKHSPSSKTMETSNSPKPTQATKPPQSIIGPADMTTGSTSPSPEFPAQAVVLGFFIGVVVAGIVFALLEWYLRRRRRSSGQSGGSKQTQYPQPPNVPGSIYEVEAPTCVSDPIIATQFGAGHRTDFLLRTPESKVRTVESTPSPLRHGLPAARTPPRRPARSDENLAAAYQDADERQGIDAKESNDSYESIDASRADFRTARSGSVRSTETISVKLMPPPLMTEGGRGVSTNTTFSAMMESVGMKRGQGPPPGNHDRWSFTKR